MLLGLAALLLPLAAESRDALLVATAASTADDAYDPVVRYDIDASLDVVEHRVTGRGTVVWRNTSRLPQRELYLHLYLNAFKDDKSVFMRSNVEGFRGGGRPARWGSIEVKRLYARELDVDLWRRVDPHTPGDPDDATDVRVPLPREVAPYDELTLEMEWVSDLPNVVMRTGFAGSFHMVAQWFPKLARLEADGTWAHFPFHRLGEFYADFGDYDVRIDVPEGVVVGATGVRDGEPKVRDGRSVHVYRARRVHDFAFTAWDGFAEIGSEAQGVSLRCLYPPGREALARLELQLVERGLAALGERYGAYPYEALTVVHPPDDAPEAGGMEYPMLITTGGSWYWPILGVRYPEIVTVHELAHQWFYGLLGSHEDRWPFLDEGFTHWASAEVLEDWYPGASGFSKLGIHVSAFSVMRADVVSSADRGRLARSANEFASGDDYATLVYSKTAVLLETLARVYGRDRLHAALGRYASRHRFGHPTPTDLLSALEEDVGPEAAAAVRRALFHGGGVDYTVAELSAGDDESFVLLRRHGELAFPVDVDLYSADGVERVSWDGREDHYELRRAGRLSAAVVDPELRVLLDDDLTNNAMRTSAARTAPRVWSNAGLLGELALRVLAP